MKFHFQQKLKPLSAAKVFSFISQYTVFFSKVTKFKKIPPEHHYFACFDFYYLLHKCRSEKKIIYLCLLVTTDPIYGILLLYCNTLHEQTKENPKETCNLNIHFHTLSFHLLMAQGLLFVHVGLYKKKTSVITVQCRRAHELDNNNGRENNKTWRKIGAIF